MECLAWPAGTRPLAGRCGRLASKIGVSKQSGEMERPSSPHRIGPASCFTGALLPADDQIVAMNHFRPPGKAEDRHDIGGGAAPDFLRILDIIGAQAAADLRAIEAADEDGAAAREVAFEPRHA